MNRELGMQIATLINRRPHFIYGGRGSSVAISKIYYHIDDFVQLEVTQCEVTDDTILTALFRDVIIARTVADNLHTNLKMSLSDLLEIVKQFFANRTTNIQNTYNFLHRN